MQALGHCACQARTVFWWKIACQRAPAHQTLGFMSSMAGIQKLMRYLAATKWCNKKLNFQIL